MHKGLLGLGLGVFLTTVSAHAATTPDKKFYVETSMARVPVQHLPDIGPNNIARLKKKATDIAGRMPADVSMSMNDFESRSLSPKLIELRGKFLQIKNPNDITAFLDEMDRDYDTYPNDLKYIAAQLVLLRPMEGIAYRLGNVFERSKVTHSFALSYMSAYAASMEVFFPTDQWESLFKYVTIPGDQSGPQFTDIADFQNFLMEAVNPAMDKAITRLDALAKSMDKSFYFDKKFLYGPASFESAVDRYRGIGPAEIYATLASLSFGIHNQLVFCAYDQMDLVKVYESIGRLYGRDALLPTRLIGVSAAEKFNRIKKFKDFLTLRPAIRNEKPSFFANIKSVFKSKSEGDAQEEQSSYGQDLMAKAFDRLKNAVQYTDASWSTIQKESVSETMPVLRPGVFQAYSREGDFQLATWKGLIDGKMPVQSALVSGDVVKVDLPSFYKQPITDLKDLFPIGFDRSPAYEHIALTSGKSVEYRNYLSGRPIQWNTAAYGKFLSTPDGALSPDHVSDAMRTLRQAWGGKQVAWPLKFVVE